MKKQASQGVIQHTTQHEEIRNFCNATIPHPWQLAKCIPNKMHTGSPWSHGLLGVFWSEKSFIPTFILSTKICALEKLANVAEVTVIGEHKVGRHV
jgi:hypothetical protein